MHNSSFLVSSRNEAASSTLSSKTKAIAEIRASVTAHVLGVLCSSSDFASFPEVIHERDWYYPSFLGPHTARTRIKLYCEKERLREDQFEHLKMLVDIGDILSACGSIKRTEKVTQSLANGTKDSISKLVSDLNSAKLEENVVSIAKGYSVGGFDGFCGRNGGVVDYVDDEVVYCKVAGECPKGRVYSLRSLGRKKRRYVDPDAAHPSTPKELLEGVQAMEQVLWLYFQV
ncbi:hypothetical protein Syun_023325 [Stephania yunnanensis]|uniref:Uncharacterized protein n=1 Tax=Stephania yunnanensis TaxID=152371 RepID=A0AAP0F9G0_9MAGN